ncbi:MAG: TolC family protein, partial [Acidobacteriota bacterium]
RSPLRLAPFLAAILIGAAGPAVSQSAPPDAPPRVFAPRPLTIGEALRAALYGNPDLLDSEDFLFSARINERAVASAYLPQVFPFFSTLRERGSGLRSQAYGLTATQQFPFGTLLEGSAVVTHAPPESPDAPYVSGYQLTLTQPLLRGADPVVTEEPLRLARRQTAGRARSLEIVRRRTVLLIYQIYLSLAREQDAVELAAERMERAHRLTEFSRARFLAGSVSKLDVLRAEQQEAAATLARNDAQNLVDDLRDQLRRAAGFKPYFDFTIQPPVDLPTVEPEPGGAVDGVSQRRPEAIEARDGIRDAQLAIRIAKSLQLPSLDGVLSYEGAGSGLTVGEALSSPHSALLFGFRSRYGLNSTVLYAQRRQAELDLEVRERDFRLLEEDLGREVRRNYRRLDSLRRNYNVAVANLEVAETQARVARLRFEKGLTDNFDVVDADNLLNSARLLELDSRLSILTARLDYLYASGFINVESFLQQR